MACCSARSLGIPSYTHCGIFSTGLPSGGVHEFGSGRGDTPLPGGSGCKLCKSRGENWGGGSTFSDMRPRDARSWSGEYALLLRECFDSERDVLR